MRRGGPTRSSDYRYIDLIVGTVTSPYYWTPILLVLYFLLSAWMAILVHPLTMFIAPAAIVAYRLWREYQMARRFMAQHYGKQRGNR